MKKYGVEGNIFRYVAEIADKCSINALHVSARDRQFIISAIDPAHVFVIEWIHREQYDTVEADKDKGSDFALDCIDLQYLAKQVNRNDIVEFCINDDGTVDIRVYSTKNDTIVKTFTLAQMNPDTADKITKMPEDPKNTVIILDRKTLYDAVKMVAGRYDDVVFEYNNGVFSVYNHVSDSDATLMLRTDITRSADDEANERSKSIYGANYLLNILKMDMQSVILMFDNDYPAKFVYTNKNNTISTLLAPRILEV